MIPIYSSIHYLSYLLYLVCHVCLIRLVCLLHLAHSKMIPKILIINAVRLICLVCLILRKLYNLACRLAALSYQLESRALKCENKNKLCEPVCVGGGVMSGRGLGNQQPILQKQSAFISARLFLLGIWKWGFE
jgi:hypothetical protein